jgi:hypothetical protein
MKVVSPERLAQMLIESHLADSADIAACSDLDISDIEGQYKVKLPESYKHFLKTFGKSSRRVLPDLDLMYPAITRQAELVARTLRGFKMPANSPNQHRQPLNFLMNTAELPGIPQSKTPVLYCPCACCFCTFDLNDNGRVMQGHALRPLRRMDVIFDGEYYMVTGLRSAEIA